MNKKITIVTSIHPDFDARIWKHATSVAAAGYDVFLICPWSVKSGTKLEGVTLLTFFPVKSRVSRVYKIPFRVIKVLKKIYSQITIIHFHDIDLLPTMGLLSFFSRKKIVYDVHENYADEVLVRSWVPKLLRYPLFYLVLVTERVFSRLVKNIVLVAPSQKKNFNNSCLNILYIKNYATVKLASKIRDDYTKRDDAVVFIGSQYENNGSLLYLDIAEEVIKVNSNIIFYATDRFGDLKFRDRYLRIISEKGISNNIKLLKNVRPSEIHSVLNKATIAIIPNLNVTKQRKAIPTKIFEFMALSLPIVASNLPYQEEIINKSNCGIIANPDKPNSFVKAILELSSDRKKSKLLGDSGNKNFQQYYSWESQVPDLISFYDKLIR